MTTTVTARRAQTQERLMAAASSVFAERGIIGASVEEITDRAGFSRGAFYSNFASKDELVLALLRREIELQFAAAERAIESVKVSAAAGGDPAESVTLAMQAFESEGQPDREWILTQQELLLYAARQAEVRDPYLAFADGYIQQFGSLIVEGLSAAGLEFVLPFEDAVSLLTACLHEDQAETLLYGQTPETSRIRIMLGVITRPV